MTYYVVAYLVTTLCAFGSVTVLSGTTADADALEANRGLFWRRPGVAVVLAAALLSLAGIPLTAGFVGKFYVLAAGVESALWLLVVLVVCNSALGLFYYLRLVVTMCTPVAPMCTPVVSMDTPVVSGDTPLPRERASPSCVLTHACADAVAPAVVPTGWWAGGVTLAVLTGLLVWLGVYPAPFLALIRLSVASLASGS